MSFLVLALLLGIKHSFDPDHLLAVSNLLARSKSLKETARMGISWAFGHMATAVIVTSLLFAFREHLAPILEHFELLVAAMLILLGVISLRQVHMHKHAHAGLMHEHLHIHDDHKHLHKHMFGIGIIHGLASNDELLVLITATLGLASFIEIIAGIVMFSAGVVAGMLLFSLVLTYPLIKSSSRKIVKLVNVIAGVLSIGYGAAILLSLA